MDLAAIVGIILGITVMVMGVLVKGDLGIFWDAASVMIVFGGTVAATLVNYPLRQITGLIGILRVAFMERRQTPGETIQLLVGLAQKARREGLLAMEEDAEAIEDAFMRKELQLVVDAQEPELVRNVLEIELAYLEERHKNGQGILESMADYSPAFGMIGTLIGLITMLGSLTDPETIAGGIAVALITTLYGVILANLLWKPLAGKLRVKTEAETLLREMMIEGILSIQAGENPQVVEEKLTSFLAPRDRKKEEEPEPAGLERAVTSNVR